ncbi:MAG TPA: 3'(2'),5'-bisphosphate nucleotidase CysQ [Polyangiaceae bacterium]|nr:3'(2'),5'-bisphosphate nucleotidase CysQ [Polyangiaceae bacterium]
MSALVDRLLEIAAEASLVVREVYETPFSVDWKGKDDPVTAADRRANELICRRIAETWPGVPIVAEESEPETFAGFQTKERVFFVDPLDGTAEFIARNGEFVVMIGMVEGDRAIAGVVTAPATGEAWAGSVGDGAFHVNAAGARQKIRVSAETRIERARGVASRSHRSPALELALRDLALGSVGAVGSAGLKGAEIAMGRADVYFGPGKVGKLWDACAVDAIVTAAGGKFSDGRGAPFDYRAGSLDNVRGLVATNGPLHDVVVSCLARLGL